MDAPRIVDLHFGRHVHPLYREQVHAVPSGWAYRSTHPAMADATAPTKRVIQQKWMGTLTRHTESVAMRVLSEAGYVHRVRARRRPDTALIHSCERLLKDPPHPYVVDLEQGSVFVIYQRAALGVPWARRALERAYLDERLKFILPWSEAARNSVFHGLSERVAEAIAHKVQVVSPAIRPQVDRPRERGSGPLRVLFVGTIFFDKGGVEALRALREARRHHDVTLDLVSYVPADVAREWSGEPGLTLHAPAGADFIRRLYAQSDVLLFPSHMDTFGYVVLEAMAHGLPVVAPRHLALRESIIEDRTGLLFPAENMLWDDDMACNFRHILPAPARYLRKLRDPGAEYVRGIAGALGRLAEDRDLHARLAAGALESVRSGHLSMGHRKALLAEIYAAAAGPA